MTLRTMTKRSEAGARPRHCPEPPSPKGSALFGRRRARWSSYDQHMTNPMMKTLLALLTLAMTSAASAQSLADAKQCSEAALTSYALSSAEPAEKIAEMAFRKCSDKWSEALDPVGKQMDANPELQEAQENCIKKLGPSSCPAPLPSSVYR